MPSIDDIQPPAELSNEQLRDVVDVLRQPLSGRHVLLPFGTQAFFRAQLTPTLTEAHEELVQVRQVDGSLKQMTRSEARVLLEQEYKERTNKQQPKETTAPLPPTAAMKQKAPDSKSTTSLPSGPAVSFYDIREEIDEQGNSIGGEAIDITQSLRKMEGLAAAESRVSAHIAGQEDDDADDMTAIDESMKSLRKLDEAEYDALAARLDQLARLEELAEQEAGSSAQSRTKLTSNSWSKGFLNKKKNPPVKTTVVPAASTSSVEPATQATPSSQRKVVGFADAAPQVKEIPRIGERSVRQEQQVLNRHKQQSTSGWSKGFLNHGNGAAVATNNGGARRQRVGLDDEAMTVQEIPAAMAPKQPRTSPSIQSFDEHVLSSVVTEHVVTERQPQEPPIEEPKKLSKFAQRRLEAMQQG